MKQLIIFITLLYGQISCLGQLSNAERDSIAGLSALDHSQMKKQLGIVIPNRTGPSGNPDAPNAANYDESRVNDYTLPDPLILNNGRQVNSPDLWWERRRAEIAEAFDREVYGRLPANTPSVSWKVVAVKETILGQYTVKEKTLRGIVDNTSYPKIQVEIEMIIATPPRAENPVPVVLEFGFIHWPFGNPPKEPASLLFSPHEPNWKEQLISRGWGYAIINPASIQADHGAGLRQGIIGLVNKGKPRKPDDWGTLRAWAWGASRAVDYFEADRDVDETRLAIEGLSRYGKAAVLTMAYEPRFSLAFIGSSGAGGTKVLRRNFGEQVENLASSSEYHWFCGNLIKYASTLTPDQLPVDAHELVALCAPRPVFIGSGSPEHEGSWVDSRGMFLAGVHAGPVYRLLGKRDLGTSDYPFLGTPLISGEIAFRQHAGGHNNGPNWSTWIAWASRYWEE